MKRSAEHCRNLSISIRKSYENGRITANRGKNEPKRFILSNGSTYMPDFVLSSSLFIEIKGWLTERAKEKMELFVKEYPQYLLVIIDSNDIKVFRGGIENAK